MVPSSTRSTIVSKESSGYSSASFGLTPTTATSSYSAARSFRRSNFAFAYGQWLQVNTTRTASSSSKSASECVSPSVPGSSKSGARSPRSIVSSDSFVTIPCSWCAHRKECSLDEGCRRSSATVQSVQKGLRRAAGEPVAVVRCREVQVRTDGDDTLRVERVVAAVVVLRDVVHVDRLGDARELVQFLQVVPEVRVVDDAAAVALEVGVVDGVEADERDEHRDVSLGQHGAGEVALVGEHVLPVVQRVEQFGHGLLVGGLRAGEPG